jgi:hypothetical protein
MSAHALLIPELDEVIERGSQANSTTTISAFSIWCSTG